jgi:hypothetical protein
VAYVGLAWFPLLIAGLSFARMAARHN